MRCAVTNCGNNNRNGNRNKWRYFHFPKDEKQLKKWFDFCGRVAINTATACICNEHFADEDFERNMQYELGFTRKNPTKLKPGSCPTIKGPQTLALEKPHLKKEHGNRNKKEENNPNHCTQNQRDLQAEADELIEIEAYDYASNVKELEAAKEPLVQMEVEILDALNPTTNSEDHVEIIDSAGDGYVKHLEIEVSNLKREVFFLKDERQQLVEEIANLKANLQNTQLQREEAVEQLKQIIKGGKVTKSSARKKTVMLFTRQARESK